MKNYLLEISAIIPATGLIQKIWLSRAGCSKDSVTLDGKTWLPVMKTGPKESRSFWENGQPTPQTVSYGSIGLIINADFENIGWASLSLINALATMWEGEDGDPFTAYKKIFTGSTGALTRNDDRNATIDLLGPEADLARPLLSATYAGTGAGEGAANLKGTYKPYLIGSCVNVLPVLLDATYWIYQVHGYGSCPVTAVYSNALSLGAATLECSTPADLRSATLKPGQWATCTSAGMFRLGADPSTAKITADAGAATTVGRAITAMMQTVGLAASRMDASIAATGRAYSLYLTAQADAGEMIRSAALDGGRYLTADGSGKFYLAPYVSTKAIIPLTADRSSTPMVQPDKITMEAAALPAYRVRVGHSRVWAVHGTSEISPALSGDAIVDQAARDAAKAADDKAKQAQSDATLANNRYAAIVNDGILDRSEKRQLARDFQSYTAERTGIIGLAAAQSVSTTDYAAAYNALSAYLSGLSPAYDDTSADTAVDPVVFTARLNGYLAARQTLLNAISAKNAKTADWSSVSGGENKPKDYADKTGDNTSKDTANVGGVPAQTIKDNIALAQKVADDAKAAADYQKNTVQPAVEQAFKDANAAIVAERDRAVGKEGELKTRIDQFVAETKSYDDTAIRALITDEAKVRADQDSAFAERARTIESNVGDAQSRVGAIETAVARGDIVVAQRANNIEAKAADAQSRVGNIETAVSNGTIASGQSVQNLSASFGAAAPNAGNLLFNTSFATLDGWSHVYNRDGVSEMVINRAGAPWQIGGTENNLTLHRGPAGDGFTAMAASTPFAVRPGSYIQFYSLVASHRCRGWVSIGYYRADGSDAGYAGENFGHYASGGNNIAAHEIVGLQRHQVPGDAVRAVLWLRQYDVQPGDGYVWFTRPFVGEVKATTAEWVPYSPGSDRVSLARSEARLSQVEQTAATANSAFVSRAETLEAQMNGEAGSNLLSRATNTASVYTDSKFGAANGRMDIMVSEYNGIGAAVYQQAGTIAKVDGRTAAYVSSTAVAGNNRAQIAIFADSNGGAGVDIVGDTTFKGSLDVRSAAGGGRTEITNQGIRVYDTNNVLRAVMGFF